MCRWYFRLYWFDVSRGNCLCCCRKPLGGGGMKPLFAYNQCRVPCLLNNLLVDRGGNPPLVDGWVGRPPTGLGVKRAGSKNCKRWAACIWKRCGGGAKIGMFVPPLTVVACFLRPLFQVQPGLETCFPLDHQISLGDTQNMPTLWVLALFGIFYKFCFHVQTCRHLGGGGGVCVYFLKSARKRHFRNVWVGGQSRAGCPNLEVVQLTLRARILHRWLKTQFVSSHCPLHCLQ